MNECCNCFYGGISAYDEPCNTCIKTINTMGTFSKWVAIDVFKNINDTTPEDIGGTGVKYDNGKPQWSLLPFKALTQVVEVLTYGAKKYAPDNWKKVPDARRRYIDAGFRHFTAYAGGETNDTETGKHHLAHAVCCMLYIIAFDLGEHNDKSNSDI